MKSKGTEGEEERGEETERKMLTEEDIRRKGLGTAMETKEHCTAYGMGKRKNTDEKTRDRHGQETQQSLKENPLQ